jgi:hypothetical protein
VEKEKEFALRRNGVVHEAKFLQLQQKIANTQWICAYAQVG